MTDTPPKKRRRLVTVFGFASFFHDIGSEMVFSVWPFFVQSLGADMAILGLIDGLGNAVVSISQAISGYISDRIRKRKVFVWIGYLLGGISRVGYAFSSSWQMLVPFRIFDRSGKMRGSPRDAIISEASNDGNRGKNFGTLRFMDNLGAVIGIIIAIVLVRHLSYRTMFLLAGIPSLIAVGIVMYFVPEAKGEKKIFRGIRFSDLTPDLWLYTALSGIFSLASFSYSFLLIAASGEGISIGAVPLLYLLFTVVAAVVSIPAGKLADKIGRKKVLFLSLLCWIGVCLTLLHGTSFLSMVIAFVLYGLHKGALDPVQKTFAAELAPKEFVASALGGFQMVLGLLSLPASLFAGLLWDRYGLSAPFLFSLILTVVAGFLLLFVHEKRSKTVYAG